MLVALTLLILFTIVLTGISTIPFSVGLLVVVSVLFRKSWVFFLAFALGLFLDLITLRSLGYTSLVFTIFVFLIRLYERKFETETIIFVFIAAFLASFIYLVTFEYDNIFIQSLVSAVMSVLLFRFFVILSKAKDLDSSSLHSSE